MLLILNANIVNEGKVFPADVLVKDGMIEQIGNNLSGLKADKVIDAAGKYLLPGVIDDQVHFREPGLTHKADIYHEARAAVAGGTTSFMEMPNTVPQSVTQELLEQKYQRAAEVSMANYSFYMGATNDNLEEVLKTDPRTVCGVKAFMGSSTGNMLVDDEKTLDALFSRVGMLIATHCEDEATIRANTEAYRAKYGEEVPIACHPEIRSREACLKSSSMAVGLAKKHGTRLHVLHISTADELALFDNSLPLSQKKITAEACTHHLWFCDADYAEKGTHIKWNPAVKSAADRDALFAAIKDGTIDVLATDHAPHTLEEKNNSYFKAPSGGPLIQYSLVAMWEKVLNKEISPERVVELMAHNPAIAFKVDKRGYVREGYHADLVILDPDASHKVERASVLSKCGWSPFEGYRFRSKVSHTLVSGHVAYENGRFDESKKGLRMRFKE